MHNSMGAQSGRDNPWHGTNAIPNIAPDQMPQSAMHTTSDQVNAKSALFTPNLMVDEALNHGQVMMQLDPPDHGLGCLDIPDISMENLGSIDLDPSDCLF